MVKYYDAFGEPTGNKKSAFVEASDYTTLEAEASRLTALVDEGKDAVGLALEYWADRQQRYKNRHPAWVRAARAFAEKAGA